VPTIKSFKTKKALLLNKIKEIDNTIFKIPETQKLRIATIYLYLKSAKNLGYNFSSKNVKKKD